MVPKWAASASPPVASNRQCISIVLQRKPTTVQARGSQLKPRKVTHLTFGSSQSHRENGVAGKPFTAMKGTSMAGPACSMKDTNEQTPNANP
jgi:hypothetical protein